MRLFYSFLLLFTTANFCVQVSAAEEEYTQGVFFVNEDWFTHQNSTINFLHDDGTWSYRIFQTANPGRELGATTQYGAIYGDKIYLVSKQEKDPGASIEGSRLAVCDAKTMKIIKEFTTIATNNEGKSIADGRSFLGVDENKGYIGTNNGIWVFNINTLTIENQIAGTENPNESGYGQLYHAQTGTMIRTEDYVFAVHQADGIKVIDPNTDTVIKTIAPPDNKGFGSIVRSKDGNLWISVAEDINGSGFSSSYFIKLNPYTFETETVQIPIDKGIENIPNSWYAWTADPFCSSTQENKIYWSGDNAIDWYQKGYRIFCYDIDNKTFSTIYDFGQMPGNWRLYSTGFRIHPTTDDIYGSLYHDTGIDTYEAVKISSKGELLQEYPMINNYWFPALPIFPDNGTPVVTDIPAIDCSYGSCDTISLKQYISDADNMTVSIVRSIKSNSISERLNAHFLNGNLILSPTKDEVANGTITVTFNSNGKIVDKEITINIEKSDSGIEQDSETNINIYTTNGYINFDNCEGYTFRLFSLDGKLIRIIEVENNRYAVEVNIPNGIYILKSSKGSYNINKKITIR